MTKAEIPAGSPQPHVSTRAEMKEYIETICRQLNLPNSCIIAMVTYLERLVANDNFELTRLNWQPSVLSGFVVAAKLCFDEPVWNEDFLRALKISNVQVGQISRWEINFLKLISFETNIELSDYASLCFRLQERYLRTRGEKVQCSSPLGDGSLPGVSGLLGSADDGLHDPLDERRQAACAVGPLAGRPLLLSTPFIARVGAFSAF